LGAEGRQFESARPDTTPVTLGSTLGVATTRADPAAAEDGHMKKVLLISLAIAALLVLALGGWAVKSVKRTPAYA
jgi:hypothetical protein